MGWKASMIIIQNPSNFNDEQLLLSSLGLENYVFHEQTVLDECIYQNDESISIGYYNNNIIICEGFKLVGGFITDTTTYLERQLISIFPDSEIISVACLSTINLHAYTLINKGYKVRLKAIDADNGLSFDLGNYIQEELEIYNDSTIENGIRYWKYKETPNEIFKEDQLLEEFTFGISKRLLGVRLDSEEGEHLLFEVPFRKYLPDPSADLIQLTSMSGTWVGYYEYGPLYGDKLYGNKVGFKLDINDQDDGSFEGLCQDLEGGGTKIGLAKISGFTNNNFISFTKEYPTIWTADESEKEETRKPKILNSQLSYKGNYNPYKKEFSGEWEILASIKYPDGSLSEQITYGTWAMKKG